MPERPPRLSRPPRPSLPFGFRYLGEPRARGYARGREAAGLRPCSCSPLAVALVQEQQARGRRRRIAAAFETVRASRRVEDVAGACRESFHGSPTLASLRATTRWRKDYRIKGRDRRSTSPSSSAAFSCTCCQRLPPHPTLRPVRQRRSGAQHRARPPSARRAQDPARQRASRSRQRDRNTFVCAPMPVLRRPHDHRRDVRRSAPWALTAAEPDQDRHLMIIALPNCSSR